MSNLPPTTTQRRNRVRGKNFTYEEDMQLCSSWIKVSNEAGFERDLKTTEIWKKIILDFRTNSEANHDMAIIEREDNSFASRWSIISKTISKYCDCIEQAMTLPPRDGVDTIIFPADELYYKGTGKKFNLHSCWNILRDSPRWLQKRRLDALKEKNKQRASTSMSVASESDEEEHPAGRKKQKLLNWADQQEEDPTVLSRSIDALLKVSAERLRILKRTEEFRILETDPSTITNVRYREYLKAQQEEIMDRLTRER